MNSYKESIYQGVSVPEILYKYRNWENQFHRSIITKREVFLAAPSTFEDQLDCKNPVRYDLLTDEQIIEKYIYESRKTNPGFSEQEHLDFAQRWAGKGLFRNKKHIAKHSRLDNISLNERLGVLCLTADPINKEMWHKYSRNSREFAIGFRTEILFDFVGSWGPVRYEPQLPRIMPTPWHDEEYQMIAQLYFKTQKWSFEKEYRTLRFSGTPLTLQDRIVELPAEAYEEIVFGPLSSPKKRKKIAEAAQSAIPSIKFRLATIEAGTRNLVLVAL
ncbi:DUF2971 domain-containing protein [Hymenobacter sp. BT664]|uniref:DUF2971 domain-containing protein n=1 Tax=Hymenobacter montanus TaxID=2771359 RepID=A0A927BEU2_9BACT|nr:DUF2971 domain-containing protein [Hymenobacter montanus]MBD2768859.1 DUF2971 domain-containing protein [Hymenobacter montanus]